MALATEPLFSLSGFSTEYAARRHYTKKRLMNSHEPCDSASHSIFYYNTGRYVLFFFPFFVAFLETFRATFFAVFFLAGFFASLIIR